MSEPLLEVENLRTRFETEGGTVSAVDGISFAVEPGEVFGIVGESGSGKSVAALSLLGLVDAPGVVEADTIRYRGENLLEKTEREFQRIRGGEISMVFQDPMSSLNPVMTIGEQIAEVARHHGDLGESVGFWSEMRRKYLGGTRSESPSWRRAVELLEIVGIPDPETRAGEYPHQLSGGMKQRVMIAQALAGDPSLIIADEPTTALDVTIEAQILNELLDLRDEFGVSVVLITHDLAVVRETCDRVAVMYAGELMETAATDALFEHPRHPYTRGLLRSIPKVTDEREWLDTIEGNVPSLVNKKPGCPFRERCDRAFELCERPLIGHEGSNTDHTVWCHLYDDSVELEDGEVVSIDEQRTAPPKKRDAESNGALSEASAELGGED
ncbi:ABC transporter ATP-binding protein [Halomarina pelagica]|uniref:ABC transporter ATP-binding protein n=1 Tax=Halomarina pelagica TaxID=2961599 RepID=UPI0020C5A66D|nr:ABC transporter ATP-binding protein [Halomarina sp. BND7]